MKGKTELINKIADLIERIEDGKELDITHELHELKYFVHESVGKPTCQLCDKELSKDEFSRNGCACDGCAIVVNEFVELIKK